MFYCKSGIYETANVNLTRNNLTRFEFDVFRPILEQMVAFDGNINDAGFIEVGESIDKLVFAFDLLKQDHSIYYNLNLKPLLI